MRNYLLLTKTLILCGLDIGPHDKGKLLDRNLMAGISLVAIVAIVAEIVKSLTGVVGAIVAAGGDGHAFVEQGLAVGMLAAFVMGVPMVLSSFYVSSDTTTLLSLPVPISTIAAARFTRCFFYAYSLVMLFALPTLISFGLATGAGVAYWVFAVVVFLLLPTVPLVYDSVIAMLVMRAFHRMHNKRLLTGIGTAVSLAFALVWVFVSVSKGQGDTMGMEAMLSSLGPVGAIFPNVPFAGAALGQLSVTGLLLYVASCAAFVALFLVVAKLVYYESVVGMTEMTTHNAALSGKDVASFGRVRSPMGAYVRVERAKILHSPFQMQVVLTELMWPAMFVIGLVMASTRPEGDVLGRVAQSAPGEQAFVILTALTLCMTFFAAATNLLPSIAISLEGTGLSLVKTLPMRLSDNLRAKVLAILPADYLLSNFIPLAATAYCIANGTSPAMLPVVVVMGIAGTVAVCYLQMLFDLKAPNLKWLDPSSVGRKAGTIISMLACIALGLVVCAVSFVPVMLLGLPSVLSTAIGLVVSVGLAIGLRAFALSYGERRLRQLP